MKKKISNGLRGGTEYNGGKNASKIIKSKDIIEFKCDFLCDQKYYEIEIKQENNEFIYSLAISMNNFIEH